MQKKQQNALGTLHLSPRLIESHLSVKNWGLVDAGFELAWDVGLLPDQIKQRLTLLNQPWWGHLAPETDLQECLGMPHEHS